MAPMEFNGSRIIYQMIILPFFMEQREQLEKINGKIEEKLNQAENMTRDGTKAGKNLLNGLGF